MTDSLPNLAANPSTLDWRTQINIFQAIKRAAQAIDDAEARSELVKPRERSWPIRWFTLDTHAKDCPCPSCRTSAVYTGVIPGQNAENINKIRAVQHGSNTCTGPSIATD